MPAEKAWREHDPFDAIEWPRTGTAFAAVVLDCDSREAVELAHACAMSAGPLPTPNLTIIRRASGNLHAAWCLARPVLRGASARPKPLRSFARISEYYRAALGADRGYVGVLSHNPLSAAYETCWLRRNPYSLQELAKPIPWHWRRPSRPTTPAGRNCALFDVLMREAGCEEMHDYEIASYGRYLNSEYETPLEDEEVDGIIKSILGHYRPQWRARGWHKETFLERQRTRGRLARNQPAAGQASGVARRQRNAARDERIVARLEAGCPARAIARAEGLDESTIRYIRTREAGVRDERPTQMIRCGGLQDDL